MRWRLLGTRLTALQRSATVASPALMYRRRNHFEDNRGATLESAPARRRNPHCSPIEDCKMILQRTCEQAHRRLE
jgi:hypothetical protein